MEDEEDEGVCVYQCVEVTNVMMVLPPPENTTTAVLVDMPGGVDAIVVTACVAACVGNVEVEETGALYTVEVAMTGVADATEEEGVMVSDEAIELEAAEHPTFKINCTPLLAQAEPKVAAAAVQISANRHERWQASWSYSVDRCSHSLRPGSLVSLIGRLVDRYKRCQCCYMLKA